MIVLFDSAGIFYAAHYIIYARISNHHFAINDNTKKNQWGTSKTDGWKKLENRFWDVIEKDKSAHKLKTGHLF
jgi:hypothetical protein